MKPMTASSGTKVVYDLEDSVTIRKEPPPGAWSAIPRKVRTLILKGTDRLRRIRLAVAVASPIKYTPPVQVVLSAWVGPDHEGCALGRAAPLHMKTGVYFGIELPAPTVAFGTDNELRSILVHEAAHCYDMITRVIRSIEEGAKPGSILSLPSPDGSIFEDHDHDENMLGNPSDWFSDEDARMISHWNDGRCDAVTEATAVRWIRLGLPWETPAVGFEVDHLQIPKPVTERIRAIAAGPISTSSEPLR